MWTALWKVSLQEQFFSHPFYYPVPQISSLPTSLGGLSRLKTLKAAGNLLNKIPETLAKASDQGGQERWGSTGEQGASQDRLRGFVHLSLTFSTLRPRALPRSPSPAMRLCSRRTPRQHWMLLTLRGPRGSSQRSSRCGPREWTQGLDPGCGLRVWSLLPDKASSNNQLTQLPTARHPRMRPRLPRRAFHPRSPNGPRRPQQCLLLLPPSTTLGLLRVLVRCGHMV